MLFLINQDNDNRNNKLNRGKFEIKILIKKKKKLMDACIPPIENLHIRAMMAPHYTFMRQNIINLYYFVRNQSTHISHFSKFHPVFYLYASCPPLINQSRSICINTQNPTRKGIFIHQI